MTFILIVVFLLLIFSVLTLFKNRKTNQFLRQEIDLKNHELLTLQQEFALTTQELKSANDIILKYSEKTIKKGEELFKVAVDNFPFPMIIFDKHLRVHFVNSQLKEITGLPETQVLGRKGEEIFPEPFAEKYVPVLKQSFESKQKQQTEISIGLEGKEQTLIINFIPLLNSDDEVNQIFGVIFNITDRKNYEKTILKLNNALEEKVRIRTRDLEKLNKELEAFSYSISHDLRAPLRSINGFTRIFFDQYFNQIDEEGKRILTIIKDSTKMMGILIDDLLEFSRLGRKGLNKSEFNMSQLVDAIFLEQKNALLPEKDLNYQINQLPVVFGDAQLIKQVWINLISNAFKFSSNRESILIEIGCQESEQEIIFYIKDNGVGFDMRYNNKLFKVFQRLHSIEEFAGTGVGLAIVKRIITSHEGRIWAESEEGKGSTFFFTIPKNEKYAA